MEMIILSVQVMLVALALWSFVVLGSIAKMMIAVRKIRGMNRRTDWLELVAVGGVFGATCFSLFGQPYAIQDVCAVLMSFGTAASFFMFYITQRHLQNIRNVREIKRSLTKQ
jgi:signal transduction histidine kinase